MSELYRDFIDRKADEIITDLGGTITPAPVNAELYRDFLGRKFDDVITAISNISTGGVLSGDTAPNNADGDNNDLYVQYDSSYNVVALYVKLNDIWRSISTTGSTHTYSTTEQVVGTWIDGKPVYERTINCGSLLNGTSSSPETLVVENIPYISDLIDFSGYAISHTSPGYCSPLPFSASGKSNIRVDFRNYELRITTYDYWASYDAYLTIRYTKNTD